MHAGEAAFVSLADALSARGFGCNGGAIPAPASPESPTFAAEPNPLPQVADPVLEPPSHLAQTQIAIREARLFRAALGEAFDAIVADLARALAVEVVARELRLGAVDLAQIARRLILERVEEEPLRLHVAAADANVVCSLPVVVDPRLEAGDAILECASGWVDARLGVRLAAVVAGAVR